MGNGSELIIRVDYFNMDLVLMLSELFPNIHSLVFFYYNWPSDVMLQILLSQFSQLSSLTLHGMPWTEKSQKRVWAVINSMPSLRRLHLLGMRNVDIPGRLPILYELEHFSLTDYNGDIVPILSQLGPVCKTVLLDFLQCSFEKLQRVFEANAHLSGSITSLFLGNMILPKINRVRPPPRIVNAMLDDLPPPELNSTENAEHIFKFVCENISQLKHLDVTFLLGKSQYTVSKQIPFNCFII